MATSKAVVKMTEVETRALRVPGVLKAHNACCRWQLLPLSTSVSWTQIAQTPHLTAELGHHPREAVGTQDVTGVPAFWCGQSLREDVTFWV